MLDAFVRFCQTPGQRLVCVPEYGDEDRELVVPIVHKLNPGADAQAIALLRSLLGDAAEDFAGYYARFDGAALFVDERSGEPLISIAAVDSWGDLNERYQALLEHLEAYADEDNDDALFDADDDIDEEGFDDEDYERELEDAMPEWTDTAVAFGEMVQSGSLFVVATEGDVCGSIYFFDQDLGEPELFATSFAELLARFVYGDAPRLLRHLTTDFGFAEGSAQADWVPQRHIVEGR